MKLIVKEKDGCAEGVVIECSTTEALVLNHAMRIYAANDEWINDISRGIMKRMLEVEPIFEETEPCKEEQKKQSEKSCKNCKHGINGMLNFKSKRCEACYYDERIGGNCLFEEKQTEEKTDKSCDDCKYAGFPPHAVCVSCVSKNRFEPKQTEEKIYKSCESCRFVDLTEHEFPCSACSASHTFRWEPRKGASE